VGGGGEGERLEGSEAVGLFRPFSFLLSHLTFTLLCSPAVASDALVADIMEATGSGGKTKQGTLQFGIAAKPGPKFEKLFNDKLHFMFQDCVLWPGLLARPSFQDVFHCLMPNLALPGRNLFAKQRSERFYECVKQVQASLCCFLARYSDLTRVHSLIPQLAKRIKSAPSVSLTSDGWIAPDGSNFEAFTFHLLDENWNQISGLAALHAAECQSVVGLPVDTAISCIDNLHCYLLPCLLPVVRHTAEHLLALLKDVKVQFVAPNALFGVDCDGAANCQKMLDLAMEQGVIKEKMWCICHWLQLSVKDALHVCLC
jgi:hypothetical protein